MEMTFCSTTWVSTQAFSAGEVAFTAATRDLITECGVYSGSASEEERPHVASQRKNGPKSHRSSLLPLRWSSPDAIVTELKDVLQLGVGLAGWGLAAYQYWRNELTERPFAAFYNHAAFKRGVGH